MNETRQFDILSPRFHADPFPTLDRMRTEAPVIRLQLPIIGPTWLPVTHDACAILLKNHETFARDPANAGIRTQARILEILPRTIGLLALNMLGHDDPEHRQLRALVDQAFQRRTVAAMKPKITAVADRLLDRLEGREHAELMAEFCRDLPLAVICEMLGLPAQDHPRFKSWLAGHGEYRRRYSGPSGRDQYCPLPAPSLAAGQRGVARWASRCFARCRDGQREAQRGRVGFHDFPALRCGSGDDHSSNCRWTVHTALARGSDRAPSQRSRPDANLC